MSEYIEKEPSPCILRFVTCRHVFYGEIQFHSSTNRNDSTENDIVLLCRAERLAFYSVTIRILFPIDRLNASPLAFGLTPVEVLPRGINASRKN